jgi:hypothetical protein
MAVKWKVGQERDFALGSVKGLAEWIRNRVRAFTGAWRGMEGKERRDTVFSHRSRTSDARLSMAASKHRITRRRSPAELIGRPSNRLMKNSCGQAKPSKASGHSGYIQTPGRF